MIIKKFTGKTEEEAVAAAKAELGENIVVMNVRNAPKKGILSIFRPPMIEVTVAKEDESEAYQQNAKAEADIKETLRAVAKVAGETSAPAASVSATSAMAKQTEQQPSPVAPTGVDRIREQQKQMASRDPEGDQIIEEKLDSLKSMLAKQIERSQKQYEELSESGKDDKDRETEEKNEEMERFVALLRTTMKDSELDEKYSEQIIEEMKAGNKPDVPFDVALASIYQRMILKFGKSVPITLAEKGPKIVFFLGPTGVGKTTTIAKLASEFALIRKKKVALLTTDTYRIAAAEQLRTYASIMEVPFRVIYSTEEMEQALEAFKNMDLIFVDTTGHSPKNVEQCENTVNFLKSVENYEKQIYLVLSATTKYKDLIDIVEIYKKMSKFDLIFTKLDETSALGNLLNLKLYTGANMSYVTNGQNVPDDIEEFDPQKTVKQLLGGR
jgi:flagellar biosynthesis protein FlhF